jgi:electron transfer flavoprotein beta subunit
VRRMAASDLGSAGQALAALESIALPQKQRSTQILPGTAKEAAAALVEKLKFEVRAL